MKVRGVLQEDETTTRESDPRAVARLLEMIGGSWTTQAIGVAAELGLADALADGARSADELAQRFECQPDALRRLLRGLAALGIVTEHDDSGFALTDVGSLLRSDCVPSLRAWARWWSGPLWSTWGTLLQSVRTGKSARELATGRRGYAHIEADPEAAAIFNRAMGDLTALIVDDLLRVVDFSAVGRVADIGGGHGELLAEILRARPGLSGLLLELPHAHEGAAARMAAAGVSDRCELRVGSFFESVPEGADVYLLKSVLHNWDDARCADVLEQLRRAMPMQARLVLIERVAPDTMRDCSTHRTLSRTDLNMLVGLGGRERRVTELDRLLSGGGFQVKRVAPLTIDYTVIEAVRS